MATKDLTERVSIEGTTTRNTHSQYDEHGCDETMHVVMDGEDVFVPWTGVQTWRYDYRNNTEDEMPESFDVNRIVVYDGRIHADADVDGGKIELQPDYSFGSSEFQGYDSWTLEMFGEDSEGDWTVVYERDD